MRRPIRLCLLLAALALLPGCGSDPSPGDAEPRRTLDSRAEAVRFFGSDTQAVVLVRSDMPRSLSELGTLARDYPGVTDAAAGIIGLIDTAGIDLVSLLRLGRDPEGEGPGSELAVGLTPGPTGPDPLLVLPTDRPGDLDELLADAVAGGRLSSAGEYDEANLYRADGAAIAVRDGVLVATSGLPELRRALATRDGEAADQVDDGEVAGALDEVPTRAPLHVVVHRGDQFAALAIRPDGSGAEIRVAADLPENAVEDDVGPHRLTVSAGELTSLLQEEAGLGPDAAAALVAGLAPLRGASYADGDRYIATFTVEPR